MPKRPPEPKKLGRPRKDKPTHPIRSIRDIDPDTYYDFTAYARKNRQTVGEALTEAMRLTLEKSRC